MKPFRRIPDATASGVGSPGVFSATVAMYYVLGQCECPLWCARTPSRGRRSDPRCRLALRPIAERDG
jgi:hypothetical protein